MAKYDHGGGCACGLYAVCECDTNRQADGARPQKGNLDLQVSRIDGAMRDIRLLGTALRDCADDLECELNARYKDRDGEIHPAERRRYDRDMSTVRAARALLERLTLAAPEDK